MAFTPRHLGPAVILAAFLVVGVRLWPYAFFRVPPPPPDRSSFSCRGAIHVHLPVDEAEFQGLARAAQDAGLDFIMFSSPGTLDPIRDGREGYYTVRGRRPPILVLGSAEVPSDRGELLLVPGRPATPFPLTRRAEALIAASRDSGGFALALRPCDAPQAAGASPSPDPPDPPPGVAGVEAISLAADFRSETYLPLAEAGLIALFNPDGALASLSRQPPAGLPPSAATSWRGSAAPFGGMGIEPASGLGRDLVPCAGGLRWVTTHLRLASELGRTPDRFAADRRLVLEALGAGRTAAVVESWGRADGFRFERVGEGAVQASIDGTTGERILIRHEARVVADGPGPRLLVEAKAPGVWRAEVYRRRRDAGLPGAGWVLWIAGPPIVIEGDPH